MVDLYEKPSPFKFGVNSKIFGSKLYYFMILRIDLFIIVAVDIHHYTRVNQKSTEDVQYPVELFDQSRPQENKTEPHKYRSDNPPKQYFMIMPGIDSESCKNKHHYKNIVDR